MNEIIVKPKSKKQSEQLQTILQKIKVKFYVSDTETEDQGLLAAIHEVEAENTKPVSELYDAMGWK
jgi:sulfopyruvate decarboxylase TPP-binding subunit